MTSTNDSALNAIEFVVFGKPVPQGSMRGTVALNNKVHLHSDNPMLRPFRQETAWTALRARTEAGCYDIFAGKHVPVSVTAEYYFAPPLHKPKHRLFPAVKPDLDKLDRAFHDACTGILWVDDGQVVKHTTAKYYGVPERMHVLVEKID